MGADRPINADVPAPELPDEPERRPPSEPEQTVARRGRRPVPGAVKLIVSLVATAIAFNVLVVVAGGGGPNKGSGGEAPAPVTAAPSGTTQTPPPSAGSPEELGYPAFATDNTTRVGGANPTANAAAVALAVFPSTTPSQRPAAVTLVGEDDWAGGIAASVLMAAPVRAPVLISGARQMPDATAQALAALDPAGAPSTGGASIFALGDVATPSGADVTPVRGGPAATVAAEVAKLRDALFGSAPDAVLVASSDQREFAMPAAAWAARSGDPVLFTGAEKLPASTAATLKRHADVPAYVLGPPSAISDAVVREIAKIDKRVTRVAGEDPVTTAIAFARFVDGEFGWDINDPGHGFVLARSDSPLDAAAAAALSASGTWGPLLLSDDAGTLPAQLHSYFLDVKPGYTTNPTRAYYNHVWVIGDQEAIDVNEQAEVNELAEVAKSREP
ncbi:MAG: hypothetical protein QOH04_1873 [Sphingomonadales bacterium]|nr:hypothetical protein [Sphingomonadales bacterium]